MIASTTTKSVKTDPDATIADDPGIFPAMLIAGLDVTSGYLVDGRVTLELTVDIDTPVVDAVSVDDGATDDELILCSTGESGIDVSTEIISSREDIELIMDSSALCISSVVDVVDTVDVWEVAVDVEGESVVFE